MDGADVLEFEVPLVAPVEETADGPEISGSGIFVSDGGREEFKKTFLRRYTGADDELRPLPGSEGQSFGGGRNHDGIEITHRIISQVIKTPPPTPGPEPSDSTLTIPERIIPG